MNDLAAYFAWWREREPVWRTQYGLGDDGCLFVASRMWADRVERVCSRIREENVKP